MPTATAPENDRPKKPSEKEQFDQLAGKAKIERDQDLAFDESVIEAAAKCYSRMTEEGADDVTKRVCIRILMDAKLSAHYEPKGINYAYFDEDEDD